MSKRSRRERRGGYYEGYNCHGWDEDDWKDFLPFSDKEIAEAKPVPPHKDLIKRVMGIQITEAHKIAEESGYDTRVLAVDGDYVKIWAAGGYGDMKRNRLNFYIWEGVVKNAFVG